MRRVSENSVNIYRLPTAFAIWRRRHGWAPLKIAHHAENQFWPSANDFHYKC